MTRLRHALAWCVLAIGAPIIVLGALLYMGWPGIKAAWVMARWFAMGMPDLKPKQGAGDIKVTVHTADVLASDSRFYRPSMPKSWLN